MYRSIFDLNLAEKKIDFCTRTFLNSADEDYIGARRAFRTGRMQSYYWSAAQSIEKYLKFGILVNGCSVKNYGHRLTELYEVWASIFSEPVADMSRVTHHAFQPRIIEPITVQNAIAQYNDYGNPDNRYGLLNVDQSGEELMVLDKFILEIRKRPKYTNILGTDLISLFNQISNRTEEGEFENDWMISQDLLLERLYTRKFRIGETEELYEDFNHGNAAFFSNPTETTGFTGSTFRGSPLYVHIEKARNCGSKPDNEDIVASFIEWILCSMKMGPDVKEYVKSQRSSQE